MPTDIPRDRFELMPRREWPEPWRSMDTGAPPPRPDNISDPEAPDPARIPASDPGVLHWIDWVHRVPSWLLMSHARWRDAVQHVAETKNAEPLADLLCSDVPLHRDARRLLAQLLVELCKGRGRPTMPGHVSIEQATLRMQAKLYDLYREDGLRHDEAVREAVVHFKAEEIGGRLSGDEIAEAVTDAEVERLHSHIRGKHGPSRRAQKREKGR